MGNEKIIAILLILAILFSIASVVFNLGSGELRQKNNSPNGGIVSGNPAGGVNIMVEENLNFEAGK